MAKLQNIEDCKEAIVSITVVVDHLAVGLSELKQVVSDHVKSHASTWFWIIPTFLLVIQIIITSVLLSRGG